MKYLKVKNPQSFIDRRDALTVTFAYSAEALNVTWWQRPTKFSQDQIKQFTSKLWHKKKITTTEFLSENV